MATYTTKLNLKKPDQSDTASILDINNNMDLIDAAVKDMWKAIYPVGALYLSTVNTSPQTLFGGTWVQIKDKFLLSAGDSYAAGGTGGAATKNYTPAGTVGNHTLTTSEIPAHAHGLNSHKHSIPAHSHGLNSHVHSVPAHSHGLNSHTHGAGTLATSSAGSHNHNFKSYYAGMDGTKLFGVLAPYSGYDGQAALSAYGGYVGNQFSMTLQSAGAHTHSITGTTGAASGNTANSSAFNTGAASGNTANSSAMDSGAASGNTANAGSGGAHNHGFTGTAASINVMPPYYTVYMWRRTA